MVKALQVRWLGWLLVIGIPALAYGYLSHLQVDRQAAIFVAIAATTLALWMFSLLSDFIPALLALLALLLFGLAPESVVLSGFSSRGFLLAFSVMGLGVVIVESGLARRYTLILLRHLPANTLSHQLAVFFTGLTFTPVVPTIIGRTAIVAPVITHIAEGWDERTRQRSSTMLYTTGLDSIHYLSPWFLTATPANLMVFALLPAQEQQAFQFLFWAFAASLTGLALLVLYFLCAALFFRRSYVRVDISQEVITQELDRMGPFSGAERSALLGILLLAVGIVTEPLHKIEVHYVAFAIFCLLLFLGTLDRKTFVTKIDWAFLSLLAGMTGLLATMSHLHLDRFIMTQLDWLGDSMRQDFAQFVLILSGVILLARLVIPLNQAILIFAATLIPIATHAGIAPWVIGFIILVMAETAFFAYQSPYIFLFRDKSSSLSWDERKVQLFHGLIAFMKVPAILISIPFWQKIGVI